MSELTLTVSLDDVAELLLKHGPKLYILLRDERNQLSALEAKLASIEFKLDHMIVREIASAFQMLDSLERITSEAMRERHLIQLEANLLKNISLDPHVVIDGKSGPYWVAKCYFGLSLVSTHRRETTDAARNLLQTFIADPRQAREQFAVDLYTETMLPYCHHILEDKEAQLAQLPAHDAKRAELSKKIFWSGVKASAWTAAEGAAYLAFRSQMPNGASHAFMQDIAKKWTKFNELQKEQDDVPTQASIQKDIDERIDERCRFIATAILEKGSFSPENGGTTE